MTPTPDRLDPARVAPAHVPAWVTDPVAAGTPVSGLPVGSPGKVGVLDLGFRRDGERTVLHRRFQKSPLQVIRAHHLDRALPGVPVVQVASTGGGVVGGDRLRIDVEVGDDAHAVLTTQSATRLHRCDAGHASQMVCLRVGEGAVCEWIPDLTIPYSGSRFVQRVESTVHPTGVLVLADVVTAGREGRDHDWSAHAYDSTSVVDRPDGTGLAVDRAVFGTARAHPGPWVPAGTKAIGTLVVVAPVEASALLTALRSAIGGVVTGGASTLPSGGAWLRVTGDDAWAVRGAVLAAWSAAREVYAGHCAPDLRTT